MSLIDSHTSAESSAEKLFFAQVREDADIEIAFAGILDRQAQGVAMAKNGGAELIERLLSDRIVERLRNNEDDLYVMSYPPDDLDIVVHPFLDNELVVLAPRDHWAAGRPVTLAELAGEPFLLKEPGSGSRHAVDAFAAAAGVQLRVRLSLASNEALLELAGTGMGLTVLSRHALGERLEAEGLCVLDVAGFPLHRPWNVVHLRSKVLSLPARAFLDELRQASALPAG